MRKKKIYIQVAGNPKYAQPVPPNKAINNPSTGTPVFGQFPDIQRTDRSFEAGPIYLRHGQHTGPNRGFGLVHIWQEHFPNAATEADALPLVVALISKILQPGAAIHYEFGVGTSGNRPLVFQSEAGLLVLEERLDGRNQVFYSIVTVFEAKNAKGTLIGALS